MGPLLTEAYRWYDAYLEKKYPNLLEDVNDFVGMENISSEINQSVFNNFDKRIVDVCMSIKEDYVEDDVLIIRKLEITDKDSFDKMQLKEKVFDVFFDFDPKEQNIEFIVGNNSILGFAIENKQDQTFLGIILVICCYNENIEPISDLCDIRIQIDDDYKMKGYGTRALNLFLDKFAELSEEITFVTRIEVDNNVARWFLEENEFELTGLYNCVFDEEDTKQYEEEHKDLVSENMIEFAVMLGVWPCKLLTHCLEYTWKKYEEMDICKEEFLERIKQNVYSDK